MMRYINSHYITLLQHTRVSEKVSAKMAKTEMATRENGNSQNSYRENSHNSDQNGHNVKVVENHLVWEYTRLHQ